MRYEDNRTIWMSIRDVSLEDRPREKLEKKGAESLSDLELLMLLLSSGNGERNVSEVSNELLDILDRNEDPDLATLCAVKGMGKAKSSLVLAALELGRRRRRKFGIGATISSPGDIYREVRHYSTRCQEQFIVLVLNGAHEVINTFVATIGLVNKTLVHPREVFSDAIARRATAIALAHNHPSGTLEPSDDDISVTERIRKSGDILPHHLHRQRLLLFSGARTFVIHPIDIIYDTIT